MKFTSLLLLLAIVGGTWAQFGKTGIADILKVHNTLRSTCALGKYVPIKGKEAAPPGAWISKLNWSATLAKSAQAYANKCSAVISKTKNVGENIAIFSVPKKPTSLDGFGKQACATWQKEYATKGFEHMYDEAASKKGISHASQMVWGFGNQIGCGVKSCGLDSKTKKYKVAVVCHYDTPLQIGSTVYYAGQACEMCPEKSKCDKPTGLCV